MSTTIEVTGDQPSTIVVGRDLGFAPITAALDEAATKVLIIHARPLAHEPTALAATPAFPRLRGGHRRPS